MKHRIIFPKQATVAYIDPFLSAVRRVREVSQAEIVFDFSLTTELSPLAICFVCGLIDLAQDNQNHAKIIMPRNRRANAALKSVRLIANQSGRPKIKIAERILQVRRIDGANSGALHDMLEILAANLPIPDPAKSSIIAISTELLTNAIDHSGENRCYVCVGAWGKSKYLHIAFLDFGVGIPNKIRTRYPKLAEDISAIKAVLEEKLTVREEKIGGEGYKLIQEALKPNGGRLHIFSGRGKTVMKYDKREYNYRKAREPFNGACIDIQYNLEGTHYFTVIKEVSEEYF